MYLYATHTHLMLESGCIKKESGCISSKIIAFLRNWIYDATEAVNDL